MSHRRVVRSENRLALFGGIIALGVLLALAVGRGGRVVSGTSGPAGGSWAASAGLPASWRDESPFTAVAERVLPAVVSVEIRRLFQHPAIEPDSLEEFGWPFGPEGGIEVPSSGSGFFFDADGHILTNAHVVDGATEIRVHLANGGQLAARLRGADPATDIAVLRVDYPGTPPVVDLGDSDSLRIGEWVAAVGNPLGVLEGSVTVGVVSAKARNDISIGESTPTYQDFIQTDAAINFGNSGGPLVNARGQAVGVNTAFGGPGRGLGFAVSINLAREVARSLIENGSVKRGFLGVVLQRLDPVLAEGLGLPDARGVLVREVTSGTPAEIAGLEPGDVIVRFNGALVQDLPHFRLQVARTPHGTRVPVEVIRDGKRRTFDVELAERPDVDGPPVTQRPADPSSELGLDLLDAEDSLALGVEGVRVRGVQAGSVSSLAGVRPEDAILEVGGAAVSDPKDCLERIQRTRETGRPVVLVVRRDGQRYYLALPASRQGDRDFRP